MISLTVSLLPTPLRRTVAAPQFDSAAPAEQGTDHNIVLKDMLVAASENRNGFEHGREGETTRTGFAPSRPGSTRLVTLCMV
jgi:hypothetical protein